MARKVLKKPPPIFLTVSQEKRSPVASVYKGGVIDELGLFKSFLPPNTDHVMINLGDNIIVLFVHSPMHSAACEKLHSCNLPQKNHHVV